MFQEGSSKGSCRSDGSYRNGKLFESEDITLGAWGEYHRRHVDEAELSDEEIDKPQA